MNNATNAFHAALYRNNLAELADLNDAAVNEIREYAAANGYDASELYNLEAARIVTQGLTLDTYLKVSRAGSKMRVTRKVRRSVFVAMKTRLACAALYR